MLEIQKSLALRARSMGALLVAIMVLSLSATAQALTLTIDVSGTGTTSLGTGELTFEPGESVFLQAVPVADSGFAFSEWRGDIGGAQSNADTLNLVMDVDKTIEVVFVQPGDFTLTVTQSGPAPSSLSPGVGAFAYFAGQTATLATNVDGVSTFFGGWSGAVTSSLPFASLPMNANAAVTATYAATGFLLELAPVDGGGVAGLGSGAFGFATGTVVPLTAITNPGWRFDHWEGDIGDADADSPSIAVTMDQARLITLVLEEGNRILTVATSGAGSGTMVPAAGEHRYFDDDVALVTATADPGSVFVRWEGDIGDNPANYPELTLPMNQDRTVTAVFEPGIRLTILTSGAGNTFPAPGEYYFAPGSEVPVTANAAQGGAFLEWEGDIGDNSPSLNTLLLTMDQDRTVTAVLQPYDWTVTVNKLGSGSLSRQGTYSFFDGAFFDVSATPLANTGFAFQGWTGSVNSTEMTLLLTVNSDLDLTANFVASNDIVLTLGAGSGGTTSPVPGDYAFTSGQTFLVSALPNQGSLFLGWEGDIGAASPTANPLNLTMDQSRDVSASFEMAETQTLTINVSGAGSTLPNAGFTYTYLKGQSVQLIAFANVGGGDIFSRWTGDIDAADPKSSRLTVTMDRDRIVTAIFGEADWILTTTVDGVGALQPVAGAYPYFDGDSAVVEAVDINASGYVFSHWEGDLADQDPNARQLLLTMDQDRTVTAVFAEFDWLVNITQTGTGTIEPLGLFRVQDGAVFNVSAVREEGSRIAFAGWSGDITSTALDISFVVHGDTNVRGTFTASSDYLLTLSADSGGSVQPPPGEYAYLYGQQAAITAEPEPGYLFTGWTGNVGTADRTAPSLVLPMTDARTVRATFTELIEYDLTLATTGAGTTLPPAGATYTYLSGQSVSLLATPDEGSGEYFIRWEGDIGAANALSPSINITLDQDRSITAIFAAPDWELSVAVAGLGTVTPSPGTYLYFDGEQVTLTAVADTDAGYAFAGWLGDIADQSASALTITLPMDQDRGVTARFLPSNAIACQREDLEAALSLSDSVGAMSISEPFSVTPPIGGVRWWGLHATEPEAGTLEECAATNTFEIVLYTNSGGAVGTPVYSETFTDVLGVDTGAAVQGIPVRRFAVTLSKTLALRNGWITIRGVGSDSCAFYWLGSGDGDGQHTVQFGEGARETAPGDMAFCLIEGELQTVAPHTGDQNRDGKVELSELLRVIQLYNLSPYACAGSGEPTEDGYVPDSESPRGCAPHSSDFAPQDWSISLSELLRLIQFYASRGVIPCPNALPPTEDGYCIAKK